MLSNIIIKRANNSLFELNNRYHIYLCFLFVLLSDCIIQMTAYFLNEKPL